jgi:hypothetical protein
MVLMGVVLMVVVVVVVLCVVVGFCFLLLWCRPDSRSRSSSQEERQVVQHAPLPLQVQL